MVSLRKLTKNQPVYTKKLIRHPTNYAKRLHEMCLSHTQMNSAKLMSSTPSWVKSCELKY